MNYLDRELRPTIRVIVVTAGGYTSDGRWNCSGDAVFLAEAAASPLLAAGRVTRGDHPLKSRRKRPTVRR